MKTQRPTIQSAGVLLSRIGLLVMLALLLFAAWYGQFIIVIILGLLMSTAGLSFLWSRLALKRVVCLRSLIEQRAFPGEYIETKWSLVNRKVLPLPWVQVDDEIPYGFMPEKTLAEGSRIGFGLLNRTTALLWYTRISWKQQFYCHKRGYYPLGPLSITTGDMFGLYTCSITIPMEEHVIVYPRLFPVDQLGIPSLFPLGETKAERQIFADPTRIMGIRDYRPRDSLRHVHWKATARHQNLQVKVFEPTTTLSMAIFLAIDSFTSTDISGDEEFELAVSSAASIANHVIRQGSPVGLFVNTQCADNGQPVRILPGSGVNQLIDMLEALAKVTPRFSTDFREFLREERRGLPWGTTLICILSRPPQDLAVVFDSLKRSGYKLMVFRVGGGDEPEIDASFDIHTIPAVIDGKQ
jgi:uncharacterized protein (DUF58 family)